jgi:hypothetical protein
MVNGVLLSFAETKPDGFIVGTEFLSFKMLLKSKDPEFDTTCFAPFVLIIKPASDTTAPTLLKLIAIKTK